jgi:hypothetical protein
MGAPINPLTSSLAQTPIVGPDGKVTWQWLQFLGQLVSIQNPSIPNLPVYLSNAAAVAAGLKPGQLFRTGTPNPDLVAVVH